MSASKKYPGAGAGQRSEDVFFVSREFTSGSFEGRPFLLGSKNRKT